MNAKETSRYEILSAREWTSLTSKQQLELIDLRRNR